MVIIKLGIEDSLLKSYFEMDTEDKDALKQAGRDFMMDMINELDEASRNRTKITIMNIETT